MSTRPLVRFEQVQKSYDGETFVVKDLNLDIQQGEFLSLLGPSGSGKTTCLMMLAGFEYPTTGNIYLDQQNINRVPPHQRNIGMVFQNYALFPHMTVEKNLEYPLKVRRLSASERKAKVRKALEMVQMEAFAKRYPAQMSGGQQQRIALARALVFEPKLVLMDEPLGALDKQLREHMQLELKALHQSLGITFVYVTHDQSEALTMSDRVAVFNDGIIQQISSVHTLYEAPENPFVANFVGDNNLLTGTLSHTDGDMCQITLGDGSVIHGLNVNHTATGHAAALSIRPERIQVMAAPTHNCIPAQITNTVYLGDHVRLICKTHDQQEISIKQQISQLSSDTSLAPGAWLSLQLPPAFARVFTA